MPVRDGCQQTNPKHVNVMAHARVVEEVQGGGGLVPDRESASVKGLLA